MRTFCRIATAAGLVLAGALALPSAAGAFSIKSGFTDGCHEYVTAQAYLGSLAYLPMDKDVPIPDGEWEEIVDYLLEGHPYQPKNREEKFLIFSLLTGVRSPDIEGFSSSDLSALRAIQANPDGQYDHCLRASEDDYLDGNQATLVGCRESITTHLQKAHEFLPRPPEKQVIRVNFSLDFYGTFEVEVWAVAYYLGRSLHPLEDSFTHTLRTADLHSVIHFMNYADAIAGHLKEDRDGMAHSTAVDTCFADNNQDRVDAAIEAVTELFIASLTVLRDDMRGMENVMAVLDRWLTYTEGAELGYDEGCIRENDYCDSQWLALARTHASGPYLSCAVATTPAGRRISGSLTLFSLTAYVATLLGRRRSRRTTRSA